VELEVSMLISSMQQRTVSFQMPVDPHAFIAEHKGKHIEGQYQYCQRFQG